MRFDTTQSGEINTQIAGIKDTEWLRSKITRSILSCTLNSRDVDGEGCLNRKCLPRRQHIALQASVELHAQVYRYSTNVALCKPPCCPRRRFIFIVNVVTSGCAQNLDNAVFSAALIAYRTLHALIWPKTWLRWRCASHLRRVIPTSSGTWRCLHGCGSTTMI
jgi:hypothetical protein